MPTDELAAPTAGTGTITVRGHGRATGVPDVLRVSFTVEIRRPDVGLAWTDAGRVTEAVLSSLRQSRVDAADLATTGLAVQAETVWEERRGQRITGYLASSTLSAELTTTGPERAPADIIAAAVAAGGNDVRLSGFALDFADPDELLVRAREAAWTDARARAEQYAELAGRHLGTVLEIAEQVGGGREPRPAGRAMALAAAPMPVEPGTSEIRADVQVTWTLR